MNEIKALEKLSPFLAYKIWGTQAFSLLKTGTKSAGDPLGESLEVSCLKGQSSTLASGTGLDMIMSQNELPYLVKIIDTSDNLSIQVHPDDEYAKKIESSMGKTECWLILDAQEGSGIYLGLKKSTTKLELKKSIENSQDVSKLLNFFPVKRGDFFYVPAGAIHAIGSGIRLLEVQQNSGVTYRVWDWNRLDKEGKSRELHISKALDVIEFDISKNTQTYFKSQSNLLDDFTKSEMVAHRDFIADLYNVNTKQIKICSPSKRYGSILCLEGELRVKRGGLVVKLQQFDSLLITHNIDEDLFINGTQISTFVYVS